MKKTIKWVLLAVVIIVVVGAVYYGYRIHYVVTRGIPEAYAAWDSATLVIEYMETHDGTWPGSWDEVFGAYETLKEHGILRGYIEENIHHIAELVQIDWNADPDELAQVEFDGDGIPFSVITRADGSAFEMIWGNHEPNTLVWEYLRDKNSDN